MNTFFNQKLWLSFCLTLATVSFIFAQKTKPEVVVQTGQYSISVMEVSSDGKLLAAVGNNPGYVYVWSILSAKLIRTIDTQQRAIKELGFSRDGKSLATVSSDRRLTVWDLNTGLYTLSFNVGYGKGFDFSPDGKSIAVSPPDKETGVVILEIEKKNVVRSFEGTSGSTFSPDGKILYTNDSEGVYAWDVKGGQRVFRFTAIRPTFSLSSDGKKIAVSSDKTVSVLDSKTGAELAEIVTDGSEIALFTANGKRLVTRLGQNRIGLWDLSQKGKEKVYLDETKGFLGDFKNVREYIDLAVVTPDGANLITGHQNGIKIWDVGNGSLISEFNNRRHERYQTQISPDGRSIFLAATDYFAAPWFFWDTYNSRIPVIFKKANDFSDPILKFSPDNDNLVVSLDSRGYVFKTASLEQTGRFSEDFISFSPNGKIILTKSKQGNDKLSLRDSEAGILTRRLEGSEKFTGGRAKFAFDKKGKTIGALQFGTFSGFSVWESDTGKSITKIDLPEWWRGGAVNGSAIAFNLDSKIFAANTVYQGGGRPDGSRKIAIVLDSFESFSNAKSGNDLKKIYTELGSISSMVFSPDGKILVVHDDLRRIVEFVNVGDGKLLGSINDLPEYSRVELSRNGKRLIIWGRTASVGSRPEVQIYEIPTGELALTVRAFDDGNWIAYSPEGYYQASSDDVFKRVSWRVGTQVYDFERFYERYFKPDLIQQIFGSGKSDLKRNSIAKGFAVPPEVRISTPENVKSTTSETIALTVKAIDQGGGIKDLRLFHNGKRLSEKPRELVQPKENSVVFNVPLLPGKNVFRATAYSNDQTESEPFELTIERKALAGKSDLYILAVGINVYKNAKYNLNYAGADALALSAAIEKKGQGIFGNVYKTLITDGLATRDGIEKAFKEIALKAKPQDSFVFFYAGHGILIDSEIDANRAFYLVPNDVTQITTVGGSELAQKGISSELLRDWTTQIKAGKQLMMLDACQSGGAIQAFAERGLAEEKAMSQLARSAGIVVLTASGTEQQAIEFKKLGHGVFTYAILKGLAGEADGNPSDRIITVSEIESFLDRKVPELTKEYRGTTQYPQRYSRGQDFPLGIN